MVEKGGKDREVREVGGRTVSASTKDTEAIAPVADTFTADYAIQTQRPVHYAVVFSIFVVGATCISLPSSGLPSLSLSVGSIFILPSPLALVLARIVVAVTLLVRPVDLNYVSHMDNSILLAKLTLVSDHCSVPYSVE